MKRGRENFNGDMKTTKRRGGHVDECERWINTVIRDQVDRKTT